MLCRRMGRKMRMCSRDWKKRSPMKSQAAKSSPRKSPKSVRTLPTISALHSSIKLPQSWHDHTTNNFDSLRLCKIINTDSTSKQPLVITHSVIVQPDLSWKVFVHNHKIKWNAALSSIQERLNEASINELRMDSG